MSDRRRPHDRAGRPRPEGSRPEGSRSERELELERTLDHLLDELTRLPAPDVSQTVLARLGYRPIDRRTLRRRRLLSVVRRAGGVTLSLMVLGTGLFVADHTRRSAAPSVAIDQAVRESVERQTELLGGVAAGLRPISELPTRLAASVARPVASPPGPSDRPAPQRDAIADLGRSPWPASLLADDAIVDVASPARPLQIHADPQRSWPTERPMGVPMTVPLGRPVRPATLPNGQALDWGGDWGASWRPAWPLPAESGLQPGVGSGLGPVTAIAPLKKT